MKTLVLLQCFPVALVFTTELLIFTAIITGIVRELDEMESNS